MAPKKQMTGATAYSGYRMARIDLLLVIILTVINIVLLVSDSQTTMLFSAFVPYFAVAIAVYDGAAWFLQGSLIFAFIVLALYLLCWFFSSKHYGWLIAALVLFAVDTLAVVFYYWGMWSYGIFDMLIHAAVLYYLFRGVRCGRYLRRLPQDVPEETTVCIENTAPIRRAEDAAEAAVLAQAETSIGFVCYRTVDKVYELVINGFVYAEAELLMETAHELRAIYDGHFVQAGLMAGSAIRYINLDGNRIAQNL